MFMKLLATNIVANKRLGLDSNLATNFLFLNVFDSISNWFCFKEKKETSDPEINAEKINKTISAIILTNELLLNNVIKNGILGSNINVVLVKY